MEALKKFYITDNECTKEADFEARLLYSIANEIEEVKYGEGDNDLEQIKEKMEALKESLSPYEIEQLTAEIEKIEKENKQMEADIERYEKENE